MKCTKLRRTMIVTVLASLTLNAVPLSHTLAGAASGAQDHTATASADARDVYHVVFDGGANARVEAAAANKSDDIDLYIYDEDGNLVTKNVGSDGNPICSWTPGSKADYTIKVVNNEHHAVDYHLTTN